MKTEFVGLLFDNVVNGKSVITFAQLMCWYCSIFFTCGFGCWRPRAVYFLLEVGLAVQPVVWLQVHSWWNWIQLRRTVHDAAKSTWVSSLASFWASYSSHRVCFMI